MSNPPQPPRATGQRLPWEDLPERIRAAIQAEFGDHQPTSEEVYELIRKVVKEVNKSLVIYKYVKDFDLREDEFAKTTTKKIKRYVENNK